MITKGEPFYLRALLFVTINDWPALSNISGQKNEGFKECTYYLDETESVYLDKCKKVVYLGYHRFLLNLHPIIKKGKHFKSQAEPQRKPVLRTGEEVFGMVKDLEVIFGKGPGSQSVLNDAIGH